MFLLTAEGVPIGEMFDRIEALGVLFQVLPAVLLYGCSVLVRSTGAARFDRIQEWQRTVRWLFQCKAGGEFLGFLLLLVSNKLS